MWQYIVIDPPKDAPIIGRKYLSYGPDRVEVLIIDVVPEVPFFPCETYLKGEIYFNVIFTPISGDFISQKFSISLDSFNETIHVSDGQDVKRFTLVDL